MSGELIPLVLIPRYSTYIGTKPDDGFVTVAMDVTQYQTAIVNVWRGEMTGTSPTYAISFEESTDQVSWTTCTGGSAADPGEDTEAQYTPTLKKRWFRANVDLGGTDPAVSCWAVGFLEERLS